jgi:hypothetical protein
MTFQWPTRKRKAAAPDLPGASFTLEQDAPGGSLIHGYTPGSKEELYLARALDIVGLDYEYQVPLRGGRAIAGGQVLDFLVYAPWATPVPIMGGYYHPPLPHPTTSLYLVILKQTYGREPVVFEVEELTSVEAAVALVRERLL